MDKMHPLGRYCYLFLTTTKNISLIFHFRLHGFFSNYNKQKREKTRIVLSAQVPFKSTRKRVIAILRGVVLMVHKPVV